MIVKSTAVDSPTAPSSLRMASRICSRCAASARAASRSFGSVAGAGVAAGAPWACGALACWPSPLSAVTRPAVPTELASAAALMPSSTPGLESSTAVRTDPSPKPLARELRRAVNLVWFTWLIANSTMNRPISTVIMSE